MKRASIIKFILAVVAMLSAAGAWADTWTDPDTGYTWTYRINCDTVTLYKGPAEGTTAISPNPIGTLTIPAAIRGKPVTSIGPSAFSGCSGLTSVTIPNSVTSIGERAFYGCSGLTSVTIPDSVTSIGYSAFKGCSGLTSVTIPNSVTSIWDYAFSGCSALTSVTIPDSVTSIRDMAFSDCSSLLSFVVPSNNPSYKSISGLLLTKDGQALLRGVNGDVTIPDGVTSIESYAFNGCSGLTSVTIPDSVTSIGERAFYGCSGLTSVTIPDSVTSIGYSAFSGCSTLTIVTIPDSVTYIGASAFSDCSSLLSFVVPSNNPSYKSISGLLLTKDGQTLLRGVNGDVTIPDGVTSIGSYAFNGCSGLTSVTIPDSVTSIGSSAFSGCSTLTIVTIPDSVTNIEASAFSDCSSLLSFVVSSNNPSYKSISGLLLTEDGQTLLRGVNGDVTIPSSVTSIGRYAFSGCSGLTSVTIPNSVTSIGERAFYGCSGLTSVTIPDSVTSIGYSAFKGCSGLTSVTIPQYVCSSRLSYIFASYRSITNVVICDGVTSIGSYAFSGCSSLTNVAIPASVTSIGSYAFSGCSSLTSVTIPQYVCSSRLSNIFSDSYQSITNVVICNSATSVGNSAFYNCSGLTSVTIPESITSIEGDAFRGCSGLMSISVGSANVNYKSVNGLLLSKDGKTLVHGIVGDVTIPNSVTDIGAYAFEGCSGLTSVTIPNGVESIGEYAFCGCRGLTSVTIPNSATNLANGAFCNCTSMESVTIPASVTSIGEWTFYGCSGLTNVVFEGNAPEMGDNVFEDVASGCCAHVRRDSTGWDVDIPGTWHGIQIDYLSEVEDQYLVIDLSNGVDATFYPVTHLSNVPIGGWTDEYKTTKLVLRKIESGTFTMSGLTETTISKPFYIGVFEVTQRQWELVVGTKPSYFNNATYYMTRPVDQVSYDMIRGSSNGSKWPESSRVDDDSFLGKIQMRTGLDLDLPTEAQWEYACRAGTTSKYNNGGNSEDDLKMLGRYRGNGGPDYSQDCAVDRGTAVVGSYKPNLWGLYDMHGNVCEWCRDWYGDTLAGGVDPSGPASGLYWPRVFRGGSLVDGFNSDVCSSQYRANCYHDSSDRSACVGFRLCSEIPVSVDISNAEVLIFADTVVYSGSACEVGVASVVAGGKVLSAGVDYLVAYANNTNAGTATITLTGINFYNGTYTTNFTIRPRPLTQGMVGAIGNHPYTGKAQTPKPTVTDVERRVTLCEDVEYTLSYANNTAIGDGIVTVTGKDNYTGSIARMFVIEPSAGSELEESLGGAGKAESDGNGGWIVTLTNDVDAANLPIEIPDGLGNVTIDLNGHDLIGSEGRSAVIIVPGDEEGKPTQLTIITTGGDAIVQGGEGAPAIEVADGVQEGVLVNIGEGVTVQGGGDDVIAIDGEVGENSGTIVKATYDMSGAAWNYSAPFTYDGTEKSVEVTGLPPGVTVASYEGNTATKSGTYIAHVTFAYDERNYNEPSIADCSWTILLPPEIRNVTAKQRWPWNGKVDISFDVVGDVEAGLPAGTTPRLSVIVSNCTDGTSFEVSRSALSGDTGVTEGRRHVVWDAWADLGEVVCSSIVVRVALVDPHDKVQLWEGGPYWATTNIGAENPEDYGYYFWWGDTVGYKRENGKWVASDGSSSNFSFSSDNAPTYGKSTDTLKSEGWITATGVLAPEYDAAHVQWGKSWRMPTSDELSALNNNCDWTWASTNGINGYIVRGRGDYAHASIFLSAAGYGNGTSLSNAGSNGYWSSVPYLDNYYFSWYFHFRSVDYRTSEDTRNVGFSVRPVQGFTEEHVTTVELAGDSTPFQLDTRTSVRESAGTETLTYSSWWDGDSDATVTIAQDGVAIAEGLTGEGDYAWGVTRNGTYELTHTTYTNGVAGAVETVTFMVTGKNVPFAPGDVTVTSYSNKYDGAAHGITVASGIVGIGYKYAYGSLGTTSPTSGWSTEVPTLTDVGSMTVWCEISAPGYIAETNSATVTISKRSATVTVTGHTAEYVYDGFEKNVEGFDLATDDQLYDFNTKTYFGGISFSAKRTDVGTSYMGLAASLFANGDANFEVTYVVTDGWLRITQATVGPGGGEEPGGGEVPDGGESKFDVTVVYDGEGHTIDTNALAAAFGAAMVGDAAVEYALDDGSGEGGHAGRATLPWMAEPPVYTNTGEYVAWYRVANPNYEEFVHSAKVTVSTRPVTVASASDSWVYDGQAHSNVTVTAEGFVDGEGVVAYGFASIMDVGSIPNAFGYSFADGTVAENYSVTCMTGALSVAVADMDGWKDESKWLATLVGDGAKYDGTEKVCMVAALSYDGFVVPSFSVSDNTATNAGNYTLTVTGTGNFSGSRTFPWSIAKREVTLMSGSDSKVYDGMVLTNATVTVSGDGFVDGEGAVATHIGSQMDVGESENTFTYELTGNAKAGNYAITTVNGILAVTKAENEWLSEPTIAGWVHGQLPSAPYMGAAKFGKVTVSYSTISPEPGAYKATFTVAGTANYTGLEKVVSFVILSVEGARLLEIFDGIPTVIIPDGSHGWKVTLTNDIDVSDGPIEVPDNLGALVIDLGGHRLVGGDGQPAILVVPGVGDGEPTQLTLETTGDGAIVQGGEGAAAIEVSDGARSGVRVKVGNGITIQGGGNVSSISREGHTFVGWLPEVDTTVPTSNVMYTAQWKVNQYAVTFDANGGTGGKTVMLDYGAVLNAPIVTRMGYTFVGWSPAVAATVPNSNVTYTAQWVVNDYIVTFNLNGADGDAPNGRSVAYGAAVGTLPTATWNGYKFEGWFSAASGGTKIAETTKVTANVTYYAHWSVKTYAPGEAMPVSLVVDGATTTVDVIVGQAWGDSLPAGPTPPSGMTFVGWYTGEGGSGTQITETSVVPDKPITLYPYFVEEVRYYLYESVVGSAPTLAASEYNGYLVDAKGNAKGTIQVKVGKPGKKDGKASVKATVVVGAKKMTLNAAERGKAEIKADGPTTVALVGKGVEACEITIGAEGLSGTYGAYVIDGARNFFSSKDKVEQIEANKLADGLIGSYNLVWNGGVASVTIGKKGKAKMAATLEGGKKVTATAALLIGEEWFCVPVSAPKANLSLVVWLPAVAGHAPHVAGLGDDAVIGRPGKLAAGAKFRMDAAAFEAVLGQSALPYLPDGVSVGLSGAKWVVANGAKAGKLTMKNGVLDASRAGENPSGLKLTYSAKGGSFKGSFKAYAVVGGKLKATTVNVSGVMIGSKGYGSASIKKLGSCPVTIE